MTDHMIFLETIQDGLKQIVQPYQRDLNQKQKKADFIRSCMRYAGKNDFLRIDEILKTKLADNIKEDENFEECKSIFESLGSYASEKVEQYRIELIEDLTNRFNEAGLKIEIDFPKFTVLKGINGKIDFSNRCTTINKKQLKSIDPRRILTAVMRLKRQLYDRPYDPQKFIDSIYQVYLDIIKKEQLSFGNSVPIRRFYLDYVMSLQSKPFFQNMDKTKFKGYSLDQFSVDMWRYFQSGIGGTFDGNKLQLNPSRNQSLWLLDSQGETRQITGISFYKPE